MSAALAAVAKWLGLKILGHAAESESFMPMVMMTLVIGICGSLLVVFLPVLMSVPLVPDSLLPNYRAAAAKIPTHSLSYQELVALDAVRFRQDFSLVTDKTIAELAAQSFWCEEVPDPDDSSKTKTVCHSYTLAEVMAKLGFTPDDKQMVLLFLDSYGTPPTPTPVVPGGFFTWPTPGYTTITSPYGMRYYPCGPGIPPDKCGTWSFHTGMDIGAPEGVHVGSVWAGTVIFAGWDGGYGNIIRINHGSFISAYGHLSAFHASVGDIVNAGDWIGNVGTTGNSTGPHLHLEWWVGGKHTDPAPYFMITH